MQLADALPGITDHRTSYPDPQLTREDDERIAQRLAALADERDLAGLLDEHWRLVGKPPELAARFTAQELGARANCDPIVDEIEEARGITVGAADRVLEIGCGTAALAGAFARRGAAATASDVSLRWLVLARQRLREAGLDNRVELVATAAEGMAFSDGSFDIVAASDVIEHVEDSDRVLAECSRVLRPGGLLFLATPNRYSLGLEPHVRLWGVGYLPRALAEAYVQAFRHTSYSHVHLLSAGELERLLARHNFDPVIVIPPVPAEAEELYSGLELSLVRAYNRLRTHDLVRPVLRAVGPFFHVFGRKTR
jgi:2-polyprenyl-3-methyl-5-hydroxy-6-metoxy-1,4-benzoquinol methylase